MAEKVFQPAFGCAQHAAPESWSKYTTGVPLTFQILLTKL